MICDTQFGRIWNATIFHSGEPMARADSTYSRDTDGKHEVKRALSKRGDDRDGHQDAGDGRENVTHAHDEVFKHASDIARCRAERDAHDERDRNGHETDRQRVTRTIADTREDIAAQIVGAEPVFARRMLHALFDVVGDDIGFVVKNVRGSKGDDDDDNEQNHTDDSALVFAQLPPDGVEGTAFFVLLRGSEFRIFHSFPSLLRVLRLDARVNEGVDDVDEQVDDRDDHRRHDKCARDHGDIALIDGVNDQTADTGPGKDRFGQN